MVLDCGANRGEFASRLALEFAARVHAFEPDPRLYPELPDVADVSYYERAVSGTGAEMTLNLGQESCSSACFSEGGNQTSVVVQATTLEDFCREQSLAAVDLLKLDIEGAEIGVLENLPANLLAGIGQITVEFHDFIDASEEPRIARVLARLKRHGFYLVRFSYHDYSDCLLINTELHPLGLPEKCGLLVRKYWRGVRRKLVKRRENGC